MVESIVAVSTNSGLIEALVLLFFGVMGAGVIFLIQVLLLRWIFRVDTIVDHLAAIRRQLHRAQQQQNISDR